MLHGQNKAPFPENEPVIPYTKESKERKLLQAELAKQKGQVVQIPLVIGGERIFTQDTTPVVCPHDHKTVIAMASNAGKQHVARAIEIAVEQQASWAALPWEDRAAVFLKAADLLADKYRYKINAATMLGQSKSCMQAEIDAVCELVDFLRFNVYFASELQTHQPLHSPEGQWNRLEQRGLEGFVFAIAPFNFTAISVNLAATPAMMGCSVLWKPTHTATLASLYGLEALEEAGLPKGVINMVMGDPEMIGEVALEHPALAGVHFTGSTKTFEHVWRQVAENLPKYNSYPRIVGETGGKDFVFAHSSADVKQLSIALIRGAFEYQGQKCSAASRAYIPASLWEELKEDLVSRVKRIKVGDVSDFSCFMNGVIDERAFDKISSYVDWAKTDSGAEIITGGECDKSKGYYVEPTIIQCSDPKSKTMVEEIFGPVLSIYVYEDDKLEETVKIADQSTPYALTGAIFAQDRKIINALSSSFKYTAGNFYVNDRPTGSVVGQQPFGGSRKSGTNDKAGSMLNLTRWVSVRSIKENHQTHQDFAYPFMDE